MSFKFFKSYLFIFSIIFNVFTIFSLTYLYLNSDIIAIGIGENDTSNYIDINYYWLVVTLVTLNIIITTYIRYFSIKASTFFELFTINLRLFLASTGFLSLKVFWLKTHYVDSIPLKFNFFLHRIWKPDELKVYLTDILLHRPEVERKLKEYGFVFTEERINKLLNNCTKLSDVETKLNNVLLFLDANREIIFKAKALEESYNNQTTSADVIIYYVQNFVIENHLYLFGAAFVCLGCYFFFSPSSSPDMPPSPPASYDDPDEFVRYFNAALEHLRKMMKKP